MMVKMAKKAPMSPATATTAASTTASAFTSVNEEPVIWYAFYSEAAGREYYYEPKSRTATWIMPDDQNAHPRKDDERVALPPKVKRKVSFSADTGRILGRGSAPLQTGEVGNSDRSIVQEVSKLKAEKALYRKIAIFTTFCLSALAAVAFLDSSVTIGAFLRLPSKNANGDVLGRETLGHKKQAGKTHQINNAEAIVETRIVEEDNWHFTWTFPREIVDGRPVLVIGAFSRYSRHYPFPPRLKQSSETVHDEARYLKCLARKIGRV